MSPTKQVRFLAKGILDSCKKDGVLDALALKKFISILANSEEAIIEINFFKIGRAHV